MKRLTDNYFVTGHPIGHSLSPVIHKVFFEDAEISESYGICDIPPEEIPNKFNEFRNTKKGFNVTIPNKIAAFESVDFVDDYTKKVGAVNTVKAEGGKLYGYNTDGEGFIKALEKNGVSVKGRKVCILGAGGAVNSVAVKLNLEGADVVILARRIQQAEAICKNQGFGKADFIENLNKYDYDILVNATPVGMHPNEGVSPVADFKNCEFVYDLIYNPFETEFLKIARKKKIKCDNGLWMLVLQAAASFKIWTGVYPSCKALEKAYENLCKVLEERR